jgi:hypothetical protein
MGYFNDLSIRDADTADEYEAPMRRQVNRNDCPYALTLNPATRAFEVTDRNGDVVFTSTEAREAIHERDRRNRVAAGDVRGVEASAWRKHNRRQA